MRNSEYVTCGRVCAWSRGALVVVALLVSAAEAAGQWPQWGGPQRNFCGDAGPLADKWPAEGPPKVWSRDISYGHSAIVLDEGTLYTMCRRDDQDVVLALKADTGETVWETAYAAPTKPDMQLDFGPGPHATPLVVGERVFTVGAMVHLTALDKRSGQVVWSHDLMEKLGAGHLGRGYGASPIAYDDTVIVNVGGRAAEVAGVAAFKQATGEVVWQSEHLGGGYPSPILARFNGVNHLIVTQGAERVGLDPATGKTRWRLTVDSQSAAIMATPVWIEPDRIFYTSGYGGGSRLLRLSVNDAGEYAVEELWHSRKMKVHHASVVQIGDYVYGSSGDFGPAFMMAIDLRDGAVVWRERGFAKANVLYADGKLIILDETGLLALATAAPEGLTVHSQVQMLAEKAWTAPTLAGTRLYLRDYKTIMALELGAAAGS